MSKNSDLNVPDGTAGKDHASERLSALLELERIALRRAVGVVSDLAALQARAAVVLDAYARSRSASARTLEETLSAAVPSTQGLALTDRLEGIAHDGVAANPWESRWMAGEILRAWGELSRLRDKLAHVAGAIAGAP